MTKVVGFFLMMLIAVPGASRAQDGAPINPEAVEFASPVLDATGVTGYRVEIFVAGADPLRDAPVASAGLDPSAQQVPGRLRVELKDLVLEVPDGRYIAVVQAITTVRPVLTALSAPFVLARETSVEERVEERKLDSLWTKIAVAIAGTLLLVPFIF